MQAKIADDGTPYYQFDSLNAHAIPHAVFSRLGGVSADPYQSLNLSTAVGDDPQAVAENRARAYGVLGRSTATLVHAKLAHGHDVALVTQGDQGRWVDQVDGLISADVGCGLTMNYGDCGSILLYDPHHHAIGLGHAGWRGAIANLAGALVQAMSTHFGSQPKELVAALGPCISISHYEVDTVVVEAVQQTFPKWVDRLLIPSPTHSGRFLFNLALANHIQLYEAGVKEVEMPAFCTAAHTDFFFSHRAEKGKTGRFGIALLLPNRADLA